jgi:hypothetical protein
LPPAVGLVTVRERRERRPRRDRVSRGIEARIHREVREIGVRVVGVEPLGRSESGVEVPAPRPERHVLGTRGFALRPGDQGVARRIEAETRGNAAEVTFASRISGVPHCPAVLTGSVGLRVPPQAANANSDAGARIRRAWRAALATATLLMAILS